MTLSTVNFFLSLYKRNLDAHRALELLEDYCQRLSSPADKQLRIAIEKVIYVFKSSLFQALLGSLFFPFRLITNHLLTHYDYY